MKIMVASDIHGSSVYCEQMLDDFRREGADRLLLLGDLLYHGPRNDLPNGYAPKKVIEMLNAAAPQLLCVRGNCDCEVDQMVLNFPILSESCLLFSDGVTVFATHGHTFNLSHLPPLQKGDVLLHGHTHIPAARWENGILYLNPGSVSIPKEGSAHGYLILEDGTYTQKDLSGAILDFGYLKETIAS